ncbi:MAG TPA: molybdopterin dinucleotide binding domain-containing protein [Bryobacteraceae bacterium]|nr:molybdopterin dinucleotide binding domain-containing protein [Bryobacteraceae bacterium]
MTTTRRGLLQFLGGSAVGALFTPAPWRLITDTALWSENWPGIPRPARGEARYKFTNCSLCDAGCAVRARCIGDQPVSLAGVGGGLCPFGLTAHHLPFHPARLKEGPVKEAAAAVTSAIANRGPTEHVAVLDLRPGRTASWMYRQAMASIPNGTYLAPPEPLVAVDLQKARTVLSLGAPLLDGWGTPSKVFAARDQFRLIQAEAVESRTAALADVWLPVAPGTEGALASAVTGEVDAADAARITGLSAEQVERLLNELKENGPALVVDSEMSPAVVDANVRLGGWGHTIGPRPQAPTPDAWNKAAPVADLDKVPNGSIRVLLIDESAAGAYLPWAPIEKKLAANALVVAVAPYDGGYARHAQYVLPAAIYPETMDDIPPAVDSMAATFRLAAPLVAAPAGMASVRELLGISDGLRERADAIHKVGQGLLVTYADGKSVAVKDLKADDFWKALNAGGAWTGDTKLPAERRRDEARRGREESLRHVDPEYPFTVVTERRVAGLCSPALSQIYQESNLRLAPNRIALHPSDASRCGVADGARALIETASGKREVIVTVDSSIRSGVVLAPGREDVAFTSAKVVRI